MFYKLIHKSESKDGIIYTERKRLFKYQIRITYEGVKDAVIFTSWSYMKVLRFLVGFHRSNAKYLKDNEWPLIIDQETMMCLGYFRPTVFAYWAYYCGAEVIPQEFPYMVKVTEVFDVSDF